MKNIAKMLVALILVFLCLTSFCFADEEEEIITIENNEELAELLQIKDTGSPKIAEFAEKYEGRIIEFDANTAYVNRHGNYTTRFDYLIYAFDYSETVCSGPNFQFSDVNYHDLHLEGDDVPDSFGMGLNIRVRAEVVSYNPVNELFRLKPIRITMRTAEAAPIVEDDYETLSIGGKGDLVKELQEALIEAGYLNGKADGDFGKKTEAAVIALQKDMNLPETGVADNETQMYLYGLLDN